MLEVFMWALIVFLIVVGLIICVLFATLAWLVVWFVWEAITG